MIRLAFLIAFHLLAFSLPALDVVIIGAGPAGLATAIEAHASGANVTIVEKRSTYSRAQLLFLFDYSLELLEKWRVSVPSMHIASFEGGHLMGTTKIKDLEEALAKRANELGIQVMQGSFASLAKSAVMVSMEEGECLVPYDILVGADGAHGEVREAIGVPCTVFGKAMSIGALIPLPDSIKKAEMLPATLQEGVFIKRIFFPQGRVFILQHPLGDTAQDNLRLDQQSLVAEAQKADWLEEAKWIGEGKSFITPLIPIVLQQAHTFSDEERGVILIGDAAATAPFCQAMGANTALKTAEIAGTFFANVQKDEKQSYHQFNIHMKEVTDALIEDSKYLLE